MIRKNITLVGSSKVIRDFVFLSRKRGCIRCISLQVYNKLQYVIDKRLGVQI